MAANGVKQTLSAFGQQHLFKGVGRYTNYVLDTGKGSYVWAAAEDAGFDDLTPADAEPTGRKFLDITAGIGVANLGHCHPKVNAAAISQINSLVHAQVNIGMSRKQLELIKELKPIMPKGLDSFLFWNSGAEIVEASVKLARHATKRQNVIVVQGSYHGRTFGTMAMTTSKTIYSAGYHPLMPGVYVTPFPYWHQMGFPSPETAEKCGMDMSENCLHSLELLLAQQSHPKDTACIILEPVLGEGGYVPATKRFLEGLREICDREGILLIIDEVQSGFGRTGDWWAHSQIAPNVKPDILLCAKGIANGFPLSLAITRKEISDTQPAGSMGGTYAGNAVCCAAAVAVAKVFKEEPIFDNVHARSEEIFAALQKLKKDPATGHLIADIRGMGLMVGLEFNSPAHHGGLAPRAKDSDNSQSAAKISDKVASRVQAKCLEKGMLVLTTSIFETLRFIPPLTITKEEMAECIRITTEAIKEVAQEG